MIISVSPGIVSDLPAIMPVMQAAFSPQYGEAWSLVQCTGALALSGSAMVIARVGADVEGSVCGFAIVRTILDEAELLLIATDPARQRLGVGTTLLNAVVQMTEERSVSRLYVEVRHDNPALDFYYGHHFVKIGERLNYYRRSDGQVGHALTLVRKVPV